MKKYYAGLYLGILLSLFAAGPVKAGTFTNLHAFATGNLSDGANPNGMVLINGQLYGSAGAGGGANHGMIYTLGTNGAGFVSIHDFAGAPTDGNSPNELLSVADMVYGTTASGGTNDLGTVYKMNTNGLGLVILRSFSGPPDPQYPAAGLILSGNMLYGTSQQGGANGQGTVFKLDTNGANFAVLHNFTNTPDGSIPQSRLVLNGATLYGTTLSGGSNSLGTIFKVNTDGNGYAVLWHFSNAPAATLPLVGLTYDNGALYGVAASGGTANSGAVFRVGTDGTGYTLLHSFTNNEAYSPQSSLVVKNNLLYGMTTSGGTDGSGTIFQLGTNGANFTVLKNFTNALNGVNPRGLPVLSGNTIFGVAYTGGPNGGGTAFRFVAAPAITAQPQNQTVNSGDNASFSVGVADEFPVTYQWYLNTTTPLGGQTASTLNLGNVNGGNAGNYTVVVTDNGGSVTSSPAVLSVASTLPSITAQPQNLTITNGNNAAFSVTATTSVGSLVYQWYFNTNTLIAGQTASTYNISPALTNNAGYYTVVVGNGSGSVTSGPARLTVSNPPPVITAQPQGLTVTNGNPTTFSVTAATVNGPLSYQWYFNTTTPIAGQTTSTYNIPVTFTNNAGNYTVVVANNGGTVTSSPAILTVSTNSKPVISDQVQDQVVSSGDTVNIFVTVSGLGPIRFQWYTNSVNTSIGNPSSVRTNAAFSFTCSTNNNHVYFTCIASNSLGKATSSPALLTVAGVPLILTNPQPITAGAGVTTNFSVFVAGPTMRFQWYSNNVNTAIGTGLANQTNSTYPFTAIASANGKYYSVVITNSFGRSTSSPALLTVLTVPTITIQPLPITITNSSSLTFTSGAAGGVPLGYQWFFNTNQPVTGATNTTLTVTDTNPPGYYSMRVTNSFGSATSSPALLTVLSLPIITLQPLGATITNGSSITFTSAATGTGTLGYQWLYQTNILIPGATSTSLTFATANQPGAYSMKVTNSSGAATSSPALLNIVAKPIMLSSAFDAASGSYSFSFVNVAGSTNRLMITTNLADPNAWRAIATNFMATNGTWQFTDPNTAKTNSVRLYRFSSP